MEEQHEQNVQEPKQSRFQIEQLEERIAPTQSHYPSGQFPSRPPEQHPGNGNAPGNS